MKTILSIFTQSFVLSFQEIRAAKLRSFLSLLGITIGILCIISVRTAVTSLELNIKSSFDTMGTDVLYVAKWPWIFDKDYPWWKFINRPVANKNELAQVQELTKGARASCIIFLAGNFNIIAGDEVAEKTNISGVSYDYNQVKDLEFTEGRYFTPDESNGGKAVTVLGANVAETLFGGKGSAIGQFVKINGVKLRVVGVLKKEGSDVFGITLDDNALVPFNFMGMLTNMGALDVDPWIAVVPAKGVSIEALKGELRGAMRSIRRLSPYQEDNFAINQISVFADAISGVMGIVNIGGILIGILSILVGGFGIANIMFVAVKERTYIIGIKKAIGAKRSYILLEFLLEAVVLCLIGGVAGLTLVVVLMQVLQYLATHVGESSFKFYITPYNIFLGMSISVFVGIVSGFIPAYSASRMKPVDAIRST